MNEFQFFFPIFVAIVLCCVPVIHDIYDDATDDELD